MPDALLVRRLARSPDSELLRIAKGRSEEDRGSEAIVEESAVKKRSVFGAVLGLATLFWFGNSTPFAATSEQTDLLNRAATTAQHMKQDPAFGAARNMLANAKGVLIVPSLVRGGFIFGAEGGSGVLSVKNGGSWSAPAFYTLASASFGLQAGLESAEVVMLIMSDRALDQIKGGNFKVGAGGEITVVTLGAGAAAATGDVVIWSAGTGVYGGLTLNGSIVNPRADWNQAFYGRPITVTEILANQAGNPQTTLQQQLAAL
jgi:lipid-binding SYLF domain-containing protein